VDEAFTRRLQSIVFFPSPQAKERLKIWQNAFSDNCILPPNTALERVAKQYELSGGSIMNVAQYASLMALHKQANEIAIDDILYGIKRELKKEGKTV
jgi:ATP-dependent 26S proteasome regulatory subunit